MKAMNDTAPLRVVEAVNDNGDRVFYVQERHWFTWQDYNTNARIAPYRAVRHSSKEVAEAEVRRRRPGWRVVKVGDVVR